MARRMRNVIIRWLPPVTGRFSFRSTSEKVCEVFTMGSRSSFVYFVGRMMFLSHDGLTLPECQMSEYRTLGCGRLRG